MSAQNMPWWLIAIIFISVIIGIIFIIAFWRAVFAVIKIKENTNIMIEQNNALLEILASSTISTMKFADTDKGTSRDNFVFNSIMQQVENNNKEFDILRQKLIDTNDKMVLKEMKKLNSELEDIHDSTKFNEELFDLSPTIETMINKRKKILNHY